MASAVQCKSSRVYGLVLCPRVCQLTWNLTDKNCPTTTTYEQIVFAAASERGKTNRQVDRQTDRRTQTDKKSDNKTKRYTSKQTDSKVDTGGRTLEWVEIPLIWNPLFFNVHTYKRRGKVVGSVDIEARHCRCIWWCWSRIVRYHRKSSVITENRQISSGMVDSHRESSDIITRISGCTNNAGPQCPQIWPYFRVKYMYGS